MVILLIPQLSEDVRKIGNSVTENLAKVDERLEKMEGTNKMLIIKMADKEKASSGLGQEIAFLTSLKSKVVAWDRKAETMELDRLNSVLTEEMSRIQKEIKEIQKKKYNQQNQLDGMKRNSERLSRKLEKVEIECQSACDERQAMTEEALEVLGSEAKEDIGAVMNTAKKISENFKIVKRQNECSQSAITSLSETMANNFLTLQDGIAANKQTLLLSKKQFQSQMDLIKEDAMKSDEHFEANFPSLTHATKEKRENAPGFKVLKLGKKTNDYAGITKCVALPVSEETPVWSKYKNADGKKDKIGRVIKIQNCGRQKFFQKVWPVSVEKTILVVGATGAGKSTLIDGIANFVFNVRFEDDHRLKLINLLKEEEQKKNNQALSQTDHITMYKIPYMKEGNVPYNLNIIDTPGWLRQLSYHIISYHIILYYNTIYRCG